MYFHFDNNYLHIPGVFRTQYSCLRSTNHTGFFLPPQEKKKNAGLKVNEHKHMKTSTVYEGCLLQ